MTKQAAVETIKKYLTVGAHNGEQAVLFDQKKAFEDGVVRPPVVGEPEILVGGIFEVVDDKYESADTGDQFDSLEEFVDSVATYLSGRCKKEILS